MNEAKLKELSMIAKEIRKLTIEMMGNLGSGHFGGSLSIIEILSVLYFETMNIDPKNPRWRDRDRFVLSKGHAGPALYAALAYKGYFDKEEIYTLNKPNTNLPSHCDMNKTIGVDMTAGSLGQGLSAAVGMAIAAKIDKNPCRIYALVGDGESQEGQIWEAAMLAGHKKLNNLITFLDYNKMQIDGNVKDVNNIEPVTDKWSAFGWYVQSIDGHDILQIIDAVNRAQRSEDKPSMIILNTIKGKGLYFVEGQVGSHHLAVTEDQWKSAVGQL